MGKGGGQSTSNTQQNQNVGYTPAGLSNFQSIYDKANAAASTPYQPYGGQIAAGLDPLQAAGMNTINGAANMAQPYIQQGGQMTQQGAGMVGQGYNTIGGATGLVGAGAGMIAANGQPIGEQQINRYLNPYQQDVTNATMANIDETNAQQQQQLQGNAAMQDALGGDRSAVAGAELARQQGLASNQTLAGLNQNNYAMALQTAQSQQQAGMNAGQGLIGAGSQFGALGSQEAGVGASYANLGNQYANLGTTAQNAALQGGQAQMGAGAVGQQTTQQQLTSQYQQYLQQLAFPYQQAQFLAGIGIPASGAMGGQQYQTGYTGQVMTQPGVSLAQGVVGAGALGYGMWGNQPSAARGGRINPYAVGGSVPLDEGTGEPIPHLAFGGTPYGGGSGGGNPWDVQPVNFMGGSSPGSNIQMPNTMPKVAPMAAPAPIPQQQNSLLTTAGQAGSIANAGKGLKSISNGIGGMFGGNSGAPLSLDPTAYGGSTAAPAIEPGTIGGTGMGELAAPAQASLTSAETTGGLGSVGAAGAGAADAGAAGVGTEAALGLGGEAAAGAAAEGAGEFALADLLPFLALKKGGRVGKFAPGGATYEDDDSDPSAATFEDRWHGFPISTGGEGFGSLAKAKAEAGDIIKNAPGPDWNGGNDGQPYPQPTMTASARRNTGPAYPTPDETPQTAGFNPDTASGADIMNPQNFKQNQPERQNIRSMMKDPDFWVRAGLGILGANPAHGALSAVAQGASGAIGTYDQFSKDNLTAQQKAQELAGKLKEHADKYSKIPMDKAAELELRRKGLEQDRYQWQPGNGRDPETGQIVPGAYRLPTRQGEEPQFFPNAAITGKGGSGSGATAMQKNIEYLVKSGIAQTPEAAFGLIHQSVNSPAVFARLVQAQEKILMLSPEMARKPQSEIHGEAEKIVRGMQSTVQSSQPAAAAPVSSAATAKPDPGEGNRIPGEWYIGPSGQPQQWR